MTRRCYIDIGNSRIKIWLCEQGRVIASHASFHQPALNRFAAELPPALLQPVVFVGVSSVLSDPQNEQLKDICELVWGCTPEFAVTSASMLGITCAYAQPELLGIDRWLHVLAAAGPQPACVISCGTALTIDVVDANRHVGGYILPGMNLQLTSLIQGTQRVRPYDITQDSLFPGTNTSEAVHHGILLACVAAIEKVHASIRNTAEESVRVLLTGGDAQKIGPHLQVEHAIMPELLLLGLQRYFGHSS